jgi:hypothetical protein
MLFGTFIRSPGRFPRTARVLLITSRDNAPGDALSDAASSRWAYIISSAHK